VDGSTSLVRHQGDIALIDQGRPPNLAAPICGSRMKRHVRDSNENERLDQMPTIAMVEAKPAGANPHYPVGGLDGLRAAKRIGYRTVLLTADRTSYEGVIDHIADRVIDCDTGSEDELEKTLRTEDFDVVFSWVNPYVSITNRVALRLGFGGIANPGCPATLEDKAAVRKRLDQSGIPSAQWCVIEHPATTQSCGIGYPLIVKPVDGYSSRDAQLVADAEELAEACRTHYSHPTWGKSDVRPAHRLLCEEFLPGDLVSVEGMMADGRADIWGYSDRTLAPGRSLIETSVAFAADPLHPGLRDYALDVLRSLSYRTGPFHLEVILTPAGPVLVELNPRMVGGGIHQAFDLATGGSVCETVISAYLGQRKPLPPATDAVCLYHIVAESDGIVAGADGIAEARSMPGVCSVISRARPGITITRTGSNSDRICYVVARGETRQQARERACAAASRIAIKIIQQK
jgi:biotin carboxylase